ncbi:MAG: GatB/YqeY domain-containing protein [Burkholderiales bacterium]
MTLKAQLSQDMIAARKARDETRKLALESILVAVKQREVDERKELSDAEVLGLVEKLLKQRRESIASYEQGGRPDLAAKEKAEAAILAAYMPQQLSEAEIQAAVDTAVAGAGATGPQDMGKVMAALKPQLAGRADMGKVSAIVKARLAGAK